jgi:hypothetical protein
MQRGQFQLSPASIQAPAAGGRFVLRVDASNVLGVKQGALLRRLAWRSVVVANNGMRIRTEDHPVQSSLTVIVERSGALTRLEARIAIQVLDVVGSGGWVNAGAETVIAQAPAPPAVTGLKPVSNEVPVIPGRTSASVPLVSTLVTKKPQPVRPVVSQQPQDIPGRSSRKGDLSWMSI